MRSVVLIPARYKSSRFPGKPLANILGKPMILWVAELSSKAVGKENVFVATDNKKIADIVEEAGFKSVMTSEDALTGTDRLAEAAQIIDADIYINVQGDEPILDPKDIIKIRDMKIENMHYVINGICDISKNEDPFSVNIPKVITTQNNKMIYMSRNTLPAYKDIKNAPSVYRKQVCIYAFTKDELMAFSSYGTKSMLESYEDIEILRFLELEIPVLMVETNAGSLAVDIPEDIKNVENTLKKLRK